MAAPMRRVEPARDAADVLTALLDSSVSGVVQRSDDAFAAIRSFQSSFRQIHRTPEMIRVMLQAEFNFEGVVDASVMDPAAAEEALAGDWFGCTFVVADYADVERWVDRFREEVAEGRTVVALLPARTNAGWFHTGVLEVADEVRFVRGRVQFARPSGFPDLIAVYRRHVPKRERKATEVAVISCSTSFTGTGTSFVGGLEPRTETKNK